MTPSEMKKVLVIEKVVNHQMTITDAAEKLALSTRQVKRLKKQYFIEGAQGFAHKNRGRKPVHAITNAVKEQVSELYRRTYSGSNNCHFAELLEEREAVKLSPSSVRRILLDSGLKQRSNRKHKKKHRPRNRRSQAGALWQIDASPYAWLEDRGPQLTLLGAIDDATGHVVGAAFRPTETREGYFAVMRQGMEAYGIPLSLYSDRHTIFRSPSEKLTLEQELAGEHTPLSQFGQAMAELHITHIKAMTPQAKGRIERLWGTFQDRLVIELRLLGVCTVQQANAVLPMLLEKHNAKFGVTPQSEDHAYRPLDEKTDLAYVLAVREHRQIGPGQTLSYNGKLYTLEDVDCVFEPRTLVEVRETVSGEVVIFHQGQPLLLRETDKPLRQNPKKKEKASVAQPRKPAVEHPWKKNQGKHKQVQLSTKTLRFQDAQYSQHNNYAEGAW